MKKDFGIIVVLLEYVMIRSPRSVRDRRGEEETGAKASLSHRYTNPLLLTTFSLFIFSLLVLPSHASASVTQGLVGHWTFDGRDTAWSSATTDRSGKGNTGTLTNMNRATSTAMGRIGQTLNFATTSYVSLGTPASLSFSPSTQHTVSAWFKTSLPYSGNNTIQTIVALGSQGCCGTETSIAVVDDGAGTGIYLARYSLAGLTQVNTNRDFRNSYRQWHHVVGKWDGSVMYIYLDGVFNATSSASGSISNWNNNSYIGVADGPLNHFRGNIDDVRVYNRALSDTEIKQLYTLGQVKTR